MQLKVEVDQVSSAWYCYGTIHQTLLVDLKSLMRLVSYAGGEGLQWFCKAEKFFSLVPCNVPTAADGIDNWG